MVSTLIQTFSEKRPYCRKESTSKFQNSAAPEFLIRAIFECLIFAISRTISLFVIVKLFDQKLISKWMGKKLIDRLKLLVKKLISSHGLWILS